METRPKICIDRIAPRDLMRFQPVSRMRDGRVRAISPIGKTWMNGSTLRVRFIGGTAAEQAVVDGLGLDEAPERIAHEVVEESRRQE